MRRDELFKCDFEKERKTHDDQKKHKLHSSEELFSLVTQFLSLLLKRVSREEEEEHEMLKC